MANYIYGAVALTGGLDGALDSIDGNDLKQNDAAIVFTSTATYVYTIDQANGGVESSPDRIMPDTNPGLKRWVLVSARSSESSVNTSTFNGVLNYASDDVQKALDVIDDLFDTNDFVIAPGSVSLKDAVIKSITSSSGTITPSNHSVSLIGSGKLKTVGTGSTVTFSVDDLKIVTKTTNYTITPADDIVIGDCSGGSVELTLPNASTKSVISVFKKSNSNILTIRCYGSQTIEGVPSFVISDEYGALRLMSDGANTWTTSAQMFDLPVAAAEVLGGVKVGSNLSITNGVLRTNLSAVNENIIPDTTLIRSLGSLTKQWKDIFVGPGSLYVNGQKVIQDVGGTITISADLDQNVQIRTGGGGDIEFYPAGSGNIEMKGNLSIQTGKNFLSNDGNPISCTAGFNMNGERISSVGAPLNDDDVATKAFVVSRGANASNITTGTLPSSVLPPIAITTTQTAASQVAMLALTTQEGDVVVRTDLSRSYIRNAGLTGTMSDFTELSTPVDSVLSVNTKTGSVVLTQDDVNNGTTFKQTHNDFTDALLTKLNGISAGAAVAQTPAEILTAIKTVDGASSGLDADLLDGIQPDSTAAASTIAVRDANADLLVRYLSMSHAAVSYNSDSIFYSSTDNYIRKNTLAGFKTSLGLQNVSNYAAASGATANTVALRDASGNFSAVTITGALTGNASTASKLLTARTISLSGDASGSISFDGSTDKDISVVVANDSHTHTFANLTSLPGTFEPTVESVQDIVGGMVTGNTETGIAVTYDDNLGILNFALNASPVVTLSGGVTGAATLTNVGNATISTTVVNDGHSHTLSTLPSVNEGTMVSNSATLLPTQQSVKTYVDTKVAAIVNSAPAALDTLNELSIALGNDPNFATTVSTALGQKALLTTNIIAGAGLTGGGTLAADRTITHADTSNQASITNAARTYIKDITLDTYGHITAIASGTETVVDTNTWRDIQDTPTNGATTISISSNWAYNHAALGTAHGATSANTASAIVARDASGNFSAGVITATVTTARYADLAEKYTCANIDLPIGTVICACTEGSYEVEECVIDTCSGVIGVVSAAPGFAMDIDLEHSILVGIVGKVPVRMIGVVKKGSPIVSAGQGRARQIKDESELSCKIGIALESKTEGEEQLVYCSIK